MADEHNNIPENNGAATPNGFSSKKNIIFIILVAVLTFGIGTAAIVAGVSNTPENRLSRHMRVAERYMSEMNYERAVIEYQRVLEIDPMNVDAILGLADAYIGLGDMEEAIEALRDGLERTGDERIRKKLDELTKEEPPVPSESEDSSSGSEEQEESQIPSEPDESSSESGVPEEIPDTSNLNPDPDMDPSTPTLNENEQETTNSIITQIEANSTTEVQLDGNGAKEKVKLKIENKGTEESSYTSTVQLIINGKKVFQNSYISNWREPKVELVVTDIDTSDEYKDLFLAVYNSEWYGTYQELLRVTYKNGEISVENILNTLKMIKSPEISDKYGDMSGRGYMLNPIESCEGLIKGDLIVLGNGSVKWHVCLYTEIADYFHGYINLNWKSDKLEIKHYPSGTISDIGISEELKESITIYESAGSSKEVTTVAKGERIRMTEFKYVNKELYVKVEYGKNIGWISQNALQALEDGGTLHA